MLSEISVSNQKSDKLLTMTNDPTIKYPDKNSITFEVEQLTPPDNCIEETSTADILKQFSSKIEAIYTSPKSLINGGPHAFISGMYRAYSDHRPFIISPDMIWLIICQGFSNHVNYNHKQGLDIFPDKVKTTLIVTNDNIELGNPDSPWEESSKEFCNDIAQQMGEELINTLRSDFSTTGIAEQVASEITIMNSFRAYFTYILELVICGIPKITLEGNRADWLKISEKLNVLRKYDLDWWVDKLNPTILKIADSYGETIDKTFWMNMFKVHTETSYGHPKRIDGWITDFYPYSKSGDRIDLSQISELTVEDIFHNIPNELVKVNFAVREKFDNGKMKRFVPMEYWAGFIGLQQDKSSFSLRPEIGWFVSYRNSTEFDNESGHDQITDCISYIGVNKFPEELFDRKEWELIILNFKDKISLPNNLIDLDVSRLMLIGKISFDDEKKLNTMARIKKDTMIFLNGNIIV